MHLRLRSSLSQRLFRFDSNQEHAREVPSIVQHNIFCKGELFCPDSPKMNQVHQQELFWFSP